MLKGGSSHFTALMKNLRHFILQQMELMNLQDIQVLVDETKLEEPWEKEKPCFILTGITTKEQLLSNLKEKNDTMDFK